MNTSLKIIKWLLENKKKASIKTLATAIKIDYKNTYEAVKKLTEKKILRTEKFGNTSEVSLVYALSPLLYEAEQIRKQNLSKNFTLVKDYFIKGLDTKLYVMLLFGSHARGTNTKNSDIDLLFIIPNGSSIERDILRVILTIPLDLHPTIITEKDFLLMKDSKQKTIVSEAIENNIILYGIEAYYEMLQ